MYRYFNKKKLKDLVVVSPDIGGVKMVHAYANLFQAPLAIVNKNRKSATEVEMLSVVGDVDGKNVLLVDDLTETAGTVTRAAEILKKHGAKKVYASVSHAVLNPAALNRLKASELEELVDDGHGATLKNERVQADGADRGAVTGRGDHADPQCRVRILAV